MIVFCFIPTFFLTSCLDAIQHITLNRNGDIEISFMLTVSKALFAMGGEGGSVEESFSEDIIDPEELKTLIPRAKNVETRLIDSDVDYGYLFKFTVPQDYQPDGDTPMVPRISWDNIEILLGMPMEQPGAEETVEPGPTDEMDEMGEAIFSSAKYKIQISKKLLQRSERAFIKTESGEITNLDLIDLGDTYLVNLPMLMVMNSEEPSYLVFEY